LTLFLGLQRTFFCSVFVFLGGKLCSILFWFGCRVSLIKGKNKGSKLFFIKNLEMLERSQVYVDTKQEKTPIVFKRSYNTAWHTSNMVVFDKSMPSYNAHHTKWCYFWFKSIMLVCVHNCTIVSSYCQLNYTTKYCLKT